MKETNTSGKQTGQTIHDAEIGTINFVPSAKAKYIRISLKPFRGVRVTVPRNATMAQAVEFVRQKKDWIQHTMSRISQQIGHRTLFTPETVFSTHSRQLQLISWKSEKFRAQLSTGTLKVFYPQEVDLLSEAAQETIRGFIIQTIRTEAKDYLPQRTEQLAIAHGFSYNGVSVKHVVSRWGSCSASNHINLNIHLMRLPEHLCDYVILHELAHTIHKNHGAGFWKCLDEHTAGKARLLAAEMKQYHTTQY